MDENRFEKELEKLVREVGPFQGPSEERLLELAKQSRDCRKKLDTSIQGLQDSLDYLRVSLKYLLFDLEATRRENAYLKTLLQDKE